MLNYSNYDYANELVNLIMNDSEDKALEYALANIKDGHIFMEADILIEQIGDEELTAPWSRILNRIEFEWEK